MKTCQFASIYLLVLLFHTQLATAQSKSKIYGAWYNTEETAQIEIMESKGTLLGKIVWLKNEDPEQEVFLDVVNRDSSLRDRPLMGLTILEGLSYHKGVWKGGKIYDPESGLTYSCELQLMKKDLLEVRGFLGDSWVKKTVEWHKVKD
ncbi:DUF2147 domain-containing protein [Algoriphagus halophytocola]|uniref:DUF2147 domain-containing protein n=1 Tax=Algoriphagus halophytocola TaxID=2991499 RepID=A0ABY6MHC0_9BACT|nr:MULTISPECIES: DUF2147 domain-containing protein [unclassified Algoriphagus]UZD23180.1 DUF2147 domain-containing protein [Algoriphagus sp. TR-M5]WBL44472.1 DUF2147 domain-containing protein [Algoriphagus sp. TR-M9]